MITRSELLASGASSSDVRHRVERGDLVRLCKGVYVPRGEAPSDPEKRHLATARAVAYRSDYVLSHVSATLIHGLPVGGADLTEIHMTRSGRGGQRQQAGRHVHAGLLEPQWCTTVDGIPVTTVARTLVDLATVERLEIALAATDAALHVKACCPADIFAALGSVKGHPFSRRAAAAMSQVDGRSESPGETRTRLILNSSATNLGGNQLPLTELQISVFDEQGRFVGRGDGGYPELGVLWEYDGKGKYEALLLPGQSPLDAVLAEKKREERLTELGWVVIRIDAADLRDPDRLVQRILAAITRSRRPGWLPPRGSYKIKEPIM